MAILETYSKRKKRLEKGVPDVFVYDEIPARLRVQICHIWDQAFGLEKRNHIGMNPLYIQLESSLAAEFGLFSLGNQLKGNRANIINHFMHSATTDEAIDMIEESFKLLANLSRNGIWNGLWNQEISPKEAIDDLNRRFLENGVGYALIADGIPQLIRKDNEQLHKNVIVPALLLLSDNGFSGANEEYRNAHEHYRNGRQKECLNDCLKAFESTMKTICSRRKWPYEQTDTASSLIDTCLRNGLLPEFMMSHLGTVKSSLSSAIPTVRNKLGGHGQGSEPKEVPPFYAEYLLNETAATIIFLVEAYKSQYRGVHP